MDPAANECAQHRKTVHHFNEPGHAHELTFSCYQRRPLLVEDGRKVILSEAIDRAVSHHGFRLVAFVYMPEHVHLVVFPHSADARVEQLLYAIKRPTSFRVKQQLEAAGSDLVHTLRVLERPGKMAFRFWQEGPGYDRNITDPDALREAVDYIHSNPVRRGLVETPDGWRWSSWRWYHERTHDAALPTAHGWPS
jgi:putative transposase